MTTSSALPPFKVIDAALRKTTERLLGEVTAPTECSPDWSPFEWAVARAVCSMQGISGLLATRLRWRGPSSWQAFLEEQYTQMRARDEIIDSLAHALDATFGAAAVSFVPLKGTALRALALHGPGERPQGDIDILVNPADLDSCAAPLAQLGFFPMYRMRRHAVFGPANHSSAVRQAEHRDNPLKIEVHTLVSEALPVDHVNITNSILPPEMRAGANDYANLAALMRHLCLHLAGNMRAHCARFAQVVDIARLAHRMQASDWHELIGDMAQRGSSWWLYAPLIMTERHFPGSVPPATLAALRDICPTKLRGRYETMSFGHVSWSNLHIEALPGSEWSRSYGEVLRHLRSRLLPNRLERAELSTVRIAQPQMLTQRWYGASHAERIVRWIFTRPPRVQTLLSVQAALNDSRTSAA